VTQGPSDVSYRIYRGSPLILTLILIGIWMGKMKIKGQKAHLRLQRIYLSKRGNRVAECK